MKQELKSYALFFAERKRPGNLTLSSNELAKNVSQHYCSRNLDKD